MESGFKEWKQDLCWEGAQAQDHTKSDHFKLGSTPRDPWLARFQICSQATTITDSLLSTACSSFSNLPPLQTCAVTIANYYAAAASSRATVTPGSYKIENKLATNSATSLYILVCSTLACSDWLRLTHGTSTVAPLLQADALNVEIAQPRYWLSRSNLAVGQNSTPDESSVSLEELCRLVATISGQAIPPVVACLLLSSLCCMLADSQKVRCGFESSLS